MEFTTAQIAAMLGGKVKGDPSGKISMLAKIQEAKPGHIAFLANPKYEQYIYTTQATAVIVSESFEPRKEIAATLIVVKDAYSSFTVLLEEYHKLMNFQKTGVEEPSFVGNNTTIGENIYRGAFSYIGNNVTIGRNVKVYPQVHIGDNVVIGDHTILHAGVKVYSGTRIGNNCTIHAGTVLGSDGFGFAPQADGTYKTIPQLGHVVLEDNVSIGANTVIDCATMMGDSTIIRKGVKLDNLIQIAHNVEIGKNTVIAAQTGVSGSSKVGESCIIAGQVGVGGHIEIANNTSIGGQVGITASVTEPGQQFFGTPGLPLRDFFRSFALFKKLPEINNRLRQLEGNLNSGTTDQKAPNKG